MLLLVRRSLVTLLDPHLVIPSAYASTRSHACQRTFKRSKAAQVGAVVLRVRQHERRQQAQHERRLEGRRLVRHHDAQDGRQVLAVHLPRHVDCMRAGIRGALEPSICIWMSAMM